MALCLFDGWVKLILSSQRTSESVVSCVVAGRHSTSGVLASLVGVVSEKCYKCNRYGHFARECREEQDRCYKCNQLGHIAKNCSKSIDAGVDLRFSSCFPASSVALLLCVRLSLTLVFTHLLLEQTKPCFVLLLECVCTTKVVLSIVRVILLNRVHIHQGCLPLRIFRNLYGNWPQITVVRKLPQYYGNNHIRLQTSIHIKERLHLN